MTSPLPPDPPPFPPFPVEGREQIYDSPWCGLRRDHLRLPDGSLQEHHVVEISDAVAIVPVLDDGRVVLVWQFRHPHGRTHWEIPAGRIHAGETPAQAAVRELREETGHEAARLTALPGFFPINGISDHYCHAFVAEGCRRVGEPVLDRAERLCVAVREREQVRALLLAGTFEDAFTALPLHAWFARNGR